MYYEKFMNSIPQDSGWASDASFASCGGCVSGMWGQPHEDGGVVLYSHDGQVVADGGPEARHVLIVGATGTGKSRLVVMPSLMYSLTATVKKSLVVFDVKGELRRNTEDLARANGYKTLCVNFRNPLEGNGWNPLARMNRLYFSGSQEDRETAWRLLENIIDIVFSDGNSNTDPFWRRSSASLFRGICAVLWEMKRPLTLQSIIKLGNTVPMDSDDDRNCELFTLADNMPPTCVAKRALVSFRSGSDKTRGNVLACYYGYLAPMTARDDVMKMISCKESVDFLGMGKEPTVFYICLPDDTTSLGSLQGMLITQMMQELNEVAMANEGCLPVKTDIYLDELCNVKPAIPSLETALTIARSRGIRYILAVQSYAQLCGVYGPAAETIAANCSSWIALNVSKDESFRTKLSNLCGSNYLGNPLITPSQLALLRYEEGVIIRERSLPYFSQLEDVSKIVSRLKDPKHEALPGGAARKKDNSERGHAA